MIRSVHAVSRFEKHAFSIITAAVAAMMLAAPQPAKAQSPRWAMNGAGCVPTGTTIQLENYLMVAGHVKFQAGKTGQIVLTCPVAVGVGNVNRLGVAYIDSTGTGTASGVRVQLRRIRKTTGNVETVTGFDFNSNSSFPSTASWAHRGAGPASGHTLDDFNYYYYVQVTLTRSNTSDSASIGGVELSRVIT